MQRVGNLSVCPLLPNPVIKRHKAPPLEQTPNTCETKVYGGLRRGPYVTANLVIGAIALIIVYFTGLNAPIPLLATLAAGTYVMALRFHNQGASGLWVLGSFIPIVNLYVSARALALPEGYEDHRQLDGLAKVTIGSYALIALLIFAATFLPKF